MRGQPNGATPPAMRRAVLTMGATISGCAPGGQDLGLVEAAGEGSRKIRKITPCSRFPGGRQQNPKNNPMQSPPRVGFAEIRGQPHAMAAGGESRKFRGTTPCNVAGEGFQKTRNNPLTLPGSASEQHSTPAPGQGSRKIRKITPCSRVPGGRQQNPKNNPMQPPPRVGFAKVRGTAPSMAAGRESRKFRGTTPSTSRGRDSKKGGTTLSRGRDRLRAASATRRVRTNPDMLCRNLLHT
jgi:hypothetical protein